MLEVDFFDPNYDFDGEEAQEDVKEQLDDNQRTYELACKRYGVLPSRYFIKALEGQKLSLAHQEMGPKSLKPCLISLVRNTKVLELDISGNSIGEEGAHQIASLLTENMFLHTLNLSNNGLKTEGAKILTEVMKDNRLIMSINLSGNGFEEGDAQYFADMIAENVYLKELDLSHNAFREQGGVVIANALCSNTALEKLDLSWNHLRRAGAVAMAKLLTVNRTLTHLNLAWNGFAAEGCNFLCETLPKNTTLKELDLTCNRIDRACLTTLLRGVARNTSLESLKLSQNPITTEGALAILSTIEQSPSLPIKYLDITGQCVSTNFMDKLATLEESRELTADHGYVLADKEGRQDQDDFVNEDPMMVLMEFMRLRNLRLVDLFVSLDTDGSKTLTHDEFREGLLQVNVPMSAAALNRLIKKLDDDGDGEVDFAELMAGQKEHKRRLIKMRAEAKERHIPYEDTEMGRLTKKLKGILALKAAKAAALAATAVTKMKKNKQKGDENS